jgi:choline kinase
MSCRSLVGHEEELPVQALILAAGRGQRCCLQANTSKASLEIGTRSLIQHQVASLRKIGIEQIGIVTGHAAEQVQTIAGPGCEYIYNSLYAETNSLYSLWSARQWLKGSFMLLNCDVLADHRIYEMVARTPGCALAYDSASGGEDEHMKVTLDGGRLRHMSKERNGHPVHGENIGMLKFSGWEAVQSLMHETDCLVGRGITNTWAAAAFNSLAAQVAIECIDVSGLPWTEIDNQSDLQNARERILPRLNLA